MNKRIMSALLAICLLATLCACGTKTPEETQLATRGTDATGDTEALDYYVPIPFEEPETFECILQIIMDPIVDLYLDSDENVVAIRFRNEEAKSLFEAEQESICVALEDSIGQIVKLAVKGGSLKNDDTALLQMLDDEDGVYNYLLTKAGEAFRHALTEEKVTCTVTLMQAGFETGEDKDPDDDDIGGGDDLPDDDIPMDDV